MKKKFSIIIPVYNCSKFISRCIESILIQEFNDYEIIIVDNGSTDDSGKICDSYERKYNFIHVIHQKNNGVSFARNIGLNAAIGEYICFLDADDYIDDGYFRYINEILSKNEKIELLNFGFYSDVENDKLEKKSSDKISYKSKLYKTHDEIKKDFINLWDNTMLYNIWNKIYLRKIICDNDIKFSNYNWGEDVEFNRRYLDKINTLYNLSDCYYHYIREREGALTKKFKPEIFDIRKKEFEDFNSYFESWNISKDEYYEFSCRRYIERLLGCIENIYCSNMSFIQRYNAIKKMINDDITREALKFMKPKSKKVFIIMLPIKYRLTFSTMIIGRMFHFIKSKLPGVFNRLKNRR
ncbi:glycosyltransferase [uncultured Clostridium sp.]|uniref:glycosyltransferase family 2 protein n=1 Tax=uncultured Clostridium sp. TaxID=59620 RepID=UPI0027DB4C1B|nr:glycosyltransferase [uncultured Clostridium sp.]